MIPTFSTSSRIGRRLRQNATRLGAETPSWSPLLATPADPQLKSPLFAVLPAEIRRLIWELALSDFPDLSDGNRYSPTTYYTRPNYEAPRKSDVRLLRACRAVYLECWTLPFLLRDHTWWLTSSDRHANDFSFNGAWRKLEISLMHARWAQKRIEAQRLGNGSATKETDSTASSTSEVVEINELRVFAQMYRLEDGGLGLLLQMPELHPRRVILTIRHADWWFWENDEQLRFEAEWLKSTALALSTSTREIVIELETLSRKKSQLEHVAAHISRKWFFRRKDGVVLFGDTTCRSNEVSTWQGPSSWAGQRWVRDESSPGKIDYYIISVPFRLRTVVERRGGSIDEKFETMAYSPSEMRVTAPGTVLEEQGWILLDDPGSEPSVLESF